MKRRILLVCLVIIIVSQIPFAYRRYRLSRLNKTIQQLASQRIPQQTENGYVDYRGVIHVHTALGGHSTGNFAELISAAKANQLDFVIMTEHPQSEFDTSAMTLSGTHAGVLFINGNEVATSNGDRLLLIPGSLSAASMNTQSTQEIIEKQKAAGGLALAAYPAESQNWQSTSIDGVEIYNLFTNARRYNALVGFFDGLWSYGSYPDLMFANFFARPTENLTRWDQAITERRRKLVATAGNDAHSNIGLNLNDGSGKQWLGIKLDPYERSFRTVRTHVLIPKDKELSRESLLEAISQGHCYVSFDLFGDPKGFDFAVAASQLKIMGDEIVFSEGLRLTASAPLVSRFVLIKDGSVIDQKLGSAADFSLSTSGNYRLEVYLDSLPSPVKGQPWILSNPIYVR
ncbi:MAG TPA: CehA/McbA family metallohydrolase [Pyrinomonadaceae bacterium]|nr:CehA/McbA family metallohydrolase [Pyrinomonadaceae bacterium]